MVCYSSAGRQGKWLQVSKKSNLMLYCHSAMNTKNGPYKFFFYINLKILPMVWPKTIPSELQGDHHIKKNIGGLETFNFALGGNTLASGFFSAAKET